MTNLAFNDFYIKHELHRHIPIYRDSCYGARNP